MTTKQDDAIRETSSAAAEKSSAARLFDIRRIIGGLFLLYGVLLAVYGLVDGASAAKKAAGIDINLWTGLAMAVFGLLMLSWMWLRPLTVDPEAQRADEEPTREEDHAPRRS